MASFSSLVAFTVLLGILFVPSAILGCLSLCFNRRKGDRARTSLRWLKAAIFLFTGGIFFLVITRVLNIVIGFSGFSTVYSYLDEFSLASSIARVMSDLLFLLTNQAITMMLVMLGLGILLARTGTPSKFHMPAKFVALVVSAILVILTIAYFGLRIDVMRREYGYQYRITGSTAALLAQSSRQIFAAVRIVNFVTGVAVLAFAILVFTKITNKNKDYPHLKTAAIAMVICSVLWFVKLLYDVIYVGMFYDLPPVTSRMRPGEYILFVEYFFSLVTCFIIFFLLFFLGRRKVNGLWTTTSVQPAPQYGVATQEMQQQWNAAQGYSNLPPPPPGYMYVQPVAGQQVRQNDSVYVWPQQQPQPQQQQTQGVSQQTA